MVRYGFIHSKEDIKFLILFAMDLLPFPVSFSTVVDLTTWWRGRHALQHHRQGPRGDPGVRKAAALSGA